MHSRDFISEGFILLASAPMAYQIGLWSGRITVVLLTLAGLVKCYTVLRRPGTNAKCLLSLMCVLGAMFLSSLLVSAGALTHNEVVGARLRLVNGGIAIGLLSGAIALGMLGLMECQERRRYKQGRAQAMWALVSTGLMITVALVLNQCDFSGLSEWFKPKIPTGPPGGLLTFEDFNFRFRAPGTPWRLLETNAPQPEMKLSFARSSPEMTLEVIAEKYGGGISSGDLVEHGKAKLRGALNPGMIVAEQPMSLGGLSGTRVEVRGWVKRKQMVAILWSGYANGYGYELLAQGPWWDEALVSQEASNLFSCFECIDSRRVTDMGGQRFMTNFVSARYGYKVDVLNTDWRQWQALQREFAWFDFSARREAGYYLAVVPVWLGQEVEEDALRGAMLNIMGISYPDTALGNRKSMTLSGVSGVQFDYERYTYEVPYHYRLRILQGGGCGYLVCAWTERNRRDYDAALDEALERVKFEGSPAAPGEIDKLPERERATRALVLNQAGMHYYEAKDYGRAKELFAAAFGTEPQPVYCENTIMAWSFLNEPEKALAFIEEQAGAHPESWKLKAYLAQFQGRAGRTNEAVAGYEKLFVDGCNNVKALTEYVDLLVKLKRYDEATAAVRRQLTAEDQIELRLLEAEIYRERDDFPEAIRLLKAQREKAPFVPEIGHALALTYLDAGQFKPALELCQELLKTTEPSWETYFLKGRSELGLGRREAAQDSFDEARRLSPGDPDARKYMEQYSDILGPITPKQFIAPVEIPAFLTNAPKATPEGYGKEYGAYYSTRITAVEFDDENGCKQTDFGRVHVMDSSGVAAFSSIEFPFDPLNEEIHVNGVRVVESDGIVTTGRVSEVHIADELDPGVVSHKKTLNILVPGLRPGSTLEFMVTRREIGAAKEKTFLSLTFSHDIPARQSIVYVAGNASGLKFKSSPAMEPRLLSKGRYWLCEDPIVVRPEPLLPPADEWVPILWVGDSSADWTALGKRYFALVRERLTLDSALREQVRRLTGNLKTDGEKIAALARCVQTNYHYIANEFGPRGSIPELPEEMARNKFGDCKDHSVMLQQMLEAAGIPARLALVNTEAQVQKDVPSLDQFDHMIVYVPGRGTNSFIDCTQKGALLGDGPPNGLERREAFIVDKDNPRFERIPDGPAVASSLASTRRVRLLDGGDVRVEEQLSISGMLGASLREELMELPDTLRRKFLQAHLKHGQAELESWSVDDVDNPAVPLRLKLVYTVRNQFHKVEGRWLGMVPALLERRYLTYDQVDRRLSPFQLKYPIEFTSKVTLTGPKGWQPQLDENTDQRIDDAFLSAHCQQKTNGDDLSVEFTFRQKKDDFPADRYSAFRESVNHALALIGRSAAFKEEK